MLKKASSKIANNSTLRGTNQDLKLLQNLISTEKTVLLTLEKLSADYAKASEALRAWGLIEGEDLGGILTASTLLLNHFSSALSQYASHGNLMRRQLKAIRTRAENLEDLKRQQRTINRKAEETARQLKNMDPEHKNFSSRVEVLNSFREAGRDMNSKIKLEEAALADFKRTSTKMWMGLKFGGLVECCEKGAIAGRFGKLVIAEISEEITQPGVPRSLNYRRNEVESCVANAHRGVNAVTLSTVPFVGFRDRDQYFQRSEPPSETHQTPPAAFYVSSQIVYGEPSNTRPLSLLGQPQLPPSLGNELPESRTSLPYARDTPEPSLPQTLPQTLHFYQTVDDHADNVPSTATDPAASSNTARGIIGAASVLPVPATVIAPVASSDTAGNYTAGGQSVTVAQTATRRPGTFGDGPDPFGFRNLYVTREIETAPPINSDAPPEEKKTVWSKIAKLFN